MKKLSYLPHNLFFCSSSFAIPIMILSDVIGIMPALGLSLYIYLLDIKIHTNQDFYEDEIKALKKEIEELKNK